MKRQKKGLNNSVETIIERFSRLTHSPRGRYAANEKTYKELLSRLSDAPVVQDPVCTKNDTVGKPSVYAHRWSAAASVALIIGIGIAIAGVYTFRSSLFPADGPDEIPVPSTTVVQSLVFDNTTLEHVVSAVSDAYGVEISFANPSLASYRITATFSTDEPIEEILDAITEVCGLSYYKTEDGYVVDGR